MIITGIVATIRAEEGNLPLESYTPVDDPETILLIGSWTDQMAIDIIHYASPMMKTIATLREKHDLPMTVERFVSEDIESDSRFIYR